LTLGLTSLHPHAVVPSILSDEGQRIVLPAFFQRGRGTPDKTRQTFATAHPFVGSTEASGSLAARVGRIDRSTLGEEMMNKLPVIPALESSWAKAAARAHRG